MKNQAIVSNERYLITPSLLNSWAYIWNCDESASEKALQDFLKTLNREPIEDNIYMKQGREFEDECYKGNTIISPIIEGGAYQIVGKKEKTIDGMNFLLYGRLDVLKCGIIYDIKRVIRYALQKYFKSYQHGFYFELFDKAYEFDYLIYDGVNLHTEIYYRDQCESIEKAIKLFITWLANNNLLDTYKEKWKCKGEK